MTDLATFARQALIDEKFEPDLDSAATQQLASIQAAPLPSGLRDLRNLLWSSIDNAESRDLDQIEFAEELPDGGIRLLVGIADVDTEVANGTPLDQHANANATTVYTGVTVFPMLPEKLSTGLTSLNQDEDRVIVAIEVVINGDGTPRSHDVFRALARNRAKLAYDITGAWLEGRGAPPPIVAQTAGLEEQLWLQDRMASLLKTQRENAGALELETIEATPVTKNGTVEGLAVTRKNRARDLIEDFMIAANVAIAQILTERNRSAIRRVVHTPKRWSRIVEVAASYHVSLPAEPDPKALASFLAARRAADPLRFADLSLTIVKLLGPGEYVVDKPGTADDEGHFGLAAHDYTHATAPNRRYADLVSQRLIKATLDGASVPYSDDELATIAAHCTERENAANRVERRTRKSAAALLLAPRVGSVFDAIVTGVNASGTFVRLLSPPAEGRVVRGQAGMDVGERVRVKLLATDPARGYVDFVGVGVPGESGQTLPGAPRP